MLVLSASFSLRLAVCHARRSARTQRLCGKNVHALWWDFPSRALLRRSGAGVSTVVASGV